MHSPKVSIVGGSGYVAGELLRLILLHPHFSIKQVVSESLAGKPVFRAHPHLRRFTDLRFSWLSELEECDLLFLALPHGEAMRRIDRFREIAPRIIDLSADFRLKDPVDYERWYGMIHPHPELLSQFTYGIPELHREEMKNASLISSAGCNATAVILALYPLFREGLVDCERTVIEVKVGSSEGGRRGSPASHHPERSSSVRAYKPTAHRHIAEMVQELGFGKKIELHFSATSVEMVRGVQATAHIFLEDDLDERAILKLFRSYYGNEPFIRIVRERSGIHRYPDPKILYGSNYCDIGFVRDGRSNRLVVISALDNLMKGAAGQAVQSANIMFGFDEKAGLEFPGLHPV